MEPLVLVLLACVVIASAAIAGVSLIGAGYFIYKAYIYYKANGVSREEIHYHSYDHTPDIIGKDDDWKHGDH